MKIFAYSHRADETEFFRAFSEKYAVQIGLTSDAPSPENAQLAAGCPCVSVVTTPIGPELLDAFYARGVRYVSTRTIGFDHIDLDYARKIGMGVGNVTYSANSVADYTVMLILMALRKARLILDRGAVQDYSLRGVRGRELPNLTVGVVGAGRIGRAVICRLTGFGCRLLAYDLTRNEEVESFAEYAQLNRLLTESDVVTLHLPATQDNFHMINRETLAMMKPDAILVNTGRGTLVDSAALIDALEAGRLGGAALDVIENEGRLYFHDLKGEILQNRELAMLKSFPNVIVTPHTAFYTDQAVSDMVENSILSCLYTARGEPNPWRLS